MRTDEAVVPKQRKGAQSNTISSIELDSVSEACAHYQLVKDRLMNINCWAEISNNLAEFTLTDQAGLEKVGKPEKGDHIRINLPAPHTKNSGDFEWVGIEYIVTKKSIMADFESAAIIVRPVPNPLDSRDVTSHFFKEEATSTFMVRRINNTVTAEVYGRNEIPNTDTYSFLDSLRNLIVSIGAILGFSKVQWKSLVNGLLSLPNTTQTF